MSERTLEQVAAEVAPLLAALVAKHRAAVLPAGGTRPAPVVGERGTSSKGAA